MKHLLLTAMLITAPFAASAQKLSNSERDIACSTLGKLTGIVTRFRDEGQTASSAYSLMIENGLKEKMALGIVKIVYDDMPNSSPETVAGVSYLGCLEATK
jgi:hypothetical protein